MTTLHGIRQVPAAGISLIKKRETLVLGVYDDKHPYKNGKIRILTPNDTNDVEGRLTGGWGHTGEDVVIGMQVTPDLAVHWFKVDCIEKVERPIYDKIGEVTWELTDNQYSALCSFVFNLGTGDEHLHPEWTIWKRLRARQFDQVPVEMARFVNWNGSKSSGLVARRNDEIALWSADVEDSHDIPSSVTRNEATPPTSSDPTPAHRSGALVTAIASAVTGGPVLVNQAMEAIAPYSVHSDHVRQALGALAAVGAVLAVVGIIIVYLRRQRDKH